MGRIYLDYAATTPVHPEVAAAVMTSMTERWGNPSSIHWTGRQARKDIEEAREEVARLVGAKKPEQIFFTSGGTEADNLAIFGAARSRMHKGRHLVTTSIEHSAVLQSMERLARSEGFELTVLRVDGNGRVDPDEFRAALRSDTILASVMWANNEMGAIQPIRECAAIARERDVWFHVDAVQAMGQIPVDVEAAGIDSLALSGHKIYAPKGIGALYLRSGLRMESLQWGGSQERSLRPGTENLPGAVGLGVAARLARTGLEENAARLARLRDLLHREICNRLDGVTLNGHPTERVPNNLNLSFAGVLAEDLLLQLDLRKVDASGGSACSAGSLEPSPVLVALGHGVDRAKSAIRFSLGRGNDEEQILRAAEAIAEAVHHLRKLAATYR